jgi:hypothetical protein
LFSEEKQGPASVDDLVGWVERVHVESELARDKVHAAIGALQAIARQDLKSDAVTAFQEFEKTIAECEKSARDLRSCVEPMQEAAGPVFEKWNRDLLSFTSPGLRQRSQARLEETRDRYQSIVVAVEPAQSALDTFNLGLRDIALFLGHDFNSQSVFAIQDDVRTLTDMAAELDTRLGNSLSASAAYVQSAALPVAAPGGMP